MNASHLDTNGIVSNCFVANSNLDSTVVSGLGLMLLQIPLVYSPLLINHSERRKMITFVTVNPFNSDLNTVDVLIYQ